MSDSFSQFALRPASRQALAGQGITQPTPIQSAALPPLLEGRDVIGQARTGSGKTLAFALPLLERMQVGLRAAQALILVPTRELAVQVAGVIEGLAGRSGPRVALLYGGKALGPQVSALRSGAQIIVGTPGRTLDHLRQGTLRLDKVSYLVLDEADEMLDRGFAPDVERILSFAPRERQTSLFSATVASWVHEVAAKHLRSPIIAKVDPSPEQNSVSIDQTLLEVPDGQKLAVLQTLLDRRGDGAVLVFGRTKHGVKKLGAKLAAKGFPVATLQGNLSQNARDRAMEDFRAGRLPILVATNVAARGIDVTDVERVINYELPESADLFTHRIGRTGRMGRQGEAITLLAPSDAEQWRKLERDLGRRLTRQTWDEPLTSAPDLSEIAKPRRAGEWGDRSRQSSARNDRRPRQAGRSAVARQEAAAAVQGLQPVSGSNARRNGARPSRPYPNAMENRPRRPAAPPRYRWARRSPEGGR